jgi:Putative adhesin
MRQSTLLSLVTVAALTSSCSYPRFQAKKTVEFTLPAASVSRLLCTSHNGKIVVDGDPAATAVNLKAEMSVRGHTQEEANANLNLLEVGQEQTDGQLKLWGKYPTGGLNNLSPSFAFTMTVPARMQLQLETHNGDVVARGTEGPIRLETHNGSIEAKVTTAKVEVETHNGTVELDLGGSGPLDGTVTSHNGGIRVGIGNDRGTRIEASTHNGSIQAGANVAEASVSRTRLSGKIGDGSGKLVITTHNGSVTIR